MKSLRYAVRYLTFISLFFLLCSGIYDLITGIQAARTYLHWRSETYGVTTDLIVSSYIILLFRGVMVTFGCAAVGLVSAARGKIRIGYLLFLGFWTCEYMFDAFHEVYYKGVEGIEAGDIVQMTIALFTFAMIAVWKYQAAAMARLRPPPCFTFTGESMTLTRGSAAAAAWSMADEPSVDASLKHTSSQSL